MSARWRLCLMLGLVTATSWTSFGTNSARPTARAGGSEPATFTPAAPPSGVYFVLQRNLRITQDWLGDGDYGSAAQTAQGLIVLAQLYGYQGAKPEWRERTTALQQACTRLVQAAKKKDGAACRDIAKECAALLDQLAKTPPEGEKVSVKGFKPFGTTRTWMLLFDWTYTDAKSAKTAPDLERFGYALAEEANAVRHIRPDERWQKWADEVREASLRTARKAQERDLDGARKELKTVYQRCEACHQGYRQ